MAAESPPGSNSHPPSPGRTRHRKKPKNDPFLSLPDVPISASPSPDRSPGSENHDPFEDQFSEPLLTRVFLTPVLCVSFVLSLFLVDRRNRQWRVSQRGGGGAPESSLWARFSPSAWLGPEPYGDSGARVDGARDTRQSRDGARWYVKKKHRKMGKMALDDAFELRSSVIVAMIMVWVLLLLSVLWAGKKIWNRLVA